MRRVLAAIGACALLLHAAPASAGEVSGRLVLDLPGVALAELGPVVVFLEPLGTAKTSPGAGLPVETIRQRNARFEPEFLVVAAGQTVTMPNEDTIFHNVFSYSRPNDFDLGVYASGTSRDVTFAHAGLVRVYCSIHESMSATVFVAPSRWFATASAAGEFGIAEVPAGRYRLRTWNERLPEASRTIDVSSGATRVEVALGGSSP